MDGGEEIFYSSTLTTVTEGEWAGWSHYPGGDPFEDLAGPFYWKMADDGRPVCAFKPERKHMNGGGFMHGGCIMTFADFCLFVIAREVIPGGMSVTATFNGEFVGPAYEGKIVECRGEVVKAGKSLVFVRGLITTGGEPVMPFSATLKKTKRP